MLKHWVKETEDNWKKNEMETGSKIKNGFQKFCDFSSMHGFTELYYAKSVFWQLFWVISIGIAIGMTAYQVSGAIEQYTDQSSTTVIQPAKQSEIVYPPLKMCYTHWIYWVDWQKGYSMQFSKESILYGLSFLTSIYSMNWFNVSEAESNFTEAFLANNMITMSSFYMSIAKFAPLRFFEDEFFGTNYSFTGGEYFKHMEFMTYQMDSVLFCHVMKGEEIIRHIAKMKSASVYTSNTNIIQFAVNDEASLGYSAEITSREYNSYMAEWIQQHTPQYWIYDDIEAYEKATHNYSSFNPPVILFPDGYSNIGIKMAPETDEYFVTVKASAHKWKSTVQNPCNKSLCSVMSDTSCTASCINEYYYVPGQKSDFSSVFKLKKDFFQNMTQNKIYFIPKPVDSPTVTQTTDVTQLLNDTEVSMNESTTTLATAENTVSNITTEQVKKYCSKKCLSGCEKWNFEISVTSSSIYNSIHQVATKKRTNIEVDYPLDGDILMMTESDSQTWENFVGNVGGLLGIWTGASILSFVQLFYLCCCSENDGPCHPRRWFYERNHKLIAKAPVKRIHTIIIKH